METIVIVLDSGKLDNPNLDIMAAELGFYITGY